MNLNKTAKIMLGIMTFWPILSPIALFVGFIIVSGLGYLPPNDESEFPFLEMPLGLMFPFICTTFTLMFALMAFYIVHVLKNENASTTMRNVLGLGIMITPAIAMPIYYYLYIWLIEPPDWAQASSTSQKRSGSNLGVVLALVIFISLACILAGATISSVLFLLFGGTQS